MWPLLAASQSQHCYWWNEDQEENAWYNQQPEEDQQEQEGRHEDKLIEQEDTGWKADDENTDYIG